jgi:hypothetical protein
MEKQDQTQGLPSKKGVMDAINEFKDKNVAEVPVSAQPIQPPVNEPIATQPPPEAVPNKIPVASLGNPQDFEKLMNKETDPDLMTGYEIIKLPSEGKFYSNGVSEVRVEYMTSKDEDLMTTPSLIESGKMFDALIDRKVKTGGIRSFELLQGDRNAILLFLRSSSYGADYSVSVPDPRTGISFDTVVDLGLLKYKEPEEQPDEFGHYSVFIPMRKKTVKFKLLTTGQDSHIFNQAEELKKAFNAEFTEYNTMRLKASVVSINGKIDTDYIGKFIDAMPARDAMTIRRKIVAVSPDVDMRYEFTTKDGFKFFANMSIGIDFFFPET